MKHIEKKAKQPRGFTLVELMVTLAVVAILATVAIPSFQSLIQSNRMTANTNELVSALNFARSEAIKRNAAVTLTAADTNNWHNGWSITDANANTVRTQAALDGDSTLIALAGVNSITFRPTGFLQGNAAVNLEVCDSRTGETGRDIRISTTGRVNVGELACP